MIRTALMEEKVATMWLYRFLGRAYYYPDIGFVDGLCQEELWAELRAVAGMLGITLGQTIDEMEACLLPYRSNTQQLLQELQIEYTYLFINAVPSVPAPPYESVYTGTGLLMGPPVSEVLGAYRESGLVMNIDHDSLPDHFAVEIEFISYLLQKEMECDNSGEAEDAAIWQERRTRFLADHLLRWPYQLLEKVSESARHPFFHLLSTLTRIVLDSAKELVPED